MKNDTLDDGAGEDGPMIEMETISSAELAELRAGGRKVYVAFVFSRGTQQEFGAMTISGMADIRSASEVTYVTELISKQIGATSLTLINWRPLVG